MPPHLKMTPTRLEGSHLKTEANTGSRLDNRKEGSIWSSGFWNSVCLCLLRHWDASQSMGICVFAMHRFYLIVNMASWSFQTYDLSEQAVNYVIVYTKNSFSQQCSFADLQLFLHDSCFTRQNVTLKFPEHEPVDQPCVFLTSGS